MNIQEIVLPLIVGGIIADISHRIVNWWKSDNQRVEAWGRELDDKLEKKIQEKFPNFKFPAMLHQTYDSMVSLVVKTVNGMVGDGLIIRQVLRAIMKKESEKAREILLEQLKQFWEQISKGILDELPPDLKQIFNEEKEKLAVRVLTNKVPLVFPDVKKTEEEIREDVKKMAAANKINEVEGPVTKEMLEKLIEESKIRQEMLKR